MRKEETLHLSKLGNCDELMQHTYSMIPTSFMKIRNNITIIPILSVHTIDVFSLHDN
jgi:hypothetical protein